MHENPLVNYLLHKLPIPSAVTVHSKQNNFATEYGRHSPSFKSNQSSGGIHSDPLAEVQEKINSETVVNGNRY